MSQRPSENASDWGSARRMWEIPGLRAKMSLVAAAVECVYLELESGSMLAGKFCRGKHKRFDPGAPLLSARDS